MDSEYNTYGRSPERAAPHPTPVAPAPAEHLSPADERLWAMLAHLSVLLNLITGFAGVAAAFLIYLIYRDRSRYVAFQSLQALLFQLIFWAGAGLMIGLMWTVVGALSVVIIGVFLIPFALLGTFFLVLLPTLSILYGIYAGIQTNSGADFRYWLVGDLALNLVN